ncbi:MAG: exosome protein, partial [Nanoarchaeota archaeon]|nr:exosome protein [Nanoarchaeota archaeon]
IIAKQEDRVDEKGRLFIRIDKKDFIENDTVSLVDHGDCIHFSIMLAAFPKNRQKAIEVAKELFSS